MYICDDDAELSGRNDALHRLLTDLYGRPSATAFGEASLVGGAVTVAVKQPVAGTVLAALYDGEGRFLELVCTPVTTEDSTLTLPAFFSPLPEGSRITLYYTDPGRKPLCPEKTV